MKIPSSAIQPAGMLLASSLNFFGAVASVMLVPSSRDNPFFFTAMITSLIYMLSNGTKLVQELRKEKPQELTEIVILGAVDREMQRREAQAKEALIKFCR